MLRALISRHQNNAPVVAFSNTKSIALGATKYMDAASALSSAFGNGKFSVSVWFKTSTILGGQFFSNLFNGAGTLNGASQGFICYLGTDGSLYWFHRNTDNGKNLATHTTNTFNNGSWHNAVWVYDNTLGSNPVDQLKIYVDGVSQSFTGTSQGATGDFSSSQAPSVSSTVFQFAAANIDEYSTWNDALSGTDVTNIYNSGSAGNLVTHAKYANLVNWYRMGDLTDSASTVVDRKDSNSLTLTNFVSGDIVSDVS